MNMLFDADFRHEPGTEPDWQESVVLFFMDRASGLTLYSRIGTQPNARCCQEWIYIQAPDGTRFRRLRFGLPLTVDSRASDGFGAGGLTFKYTEDGRIRLRAEYPGVLAEIFYSDFYPSTPCWKWLGADDVHIGAHGHYESSGRVEGHVTLRGRRHDIADGLGHRDHSWGPRDGDNLRACRWVVGTIGFALSHSVISFIDAKGNLALGGWVVREGVVTHAKAIDIAANCNIDGLTIRGGRMGLTLEDESVVEVALTPASAFITGHDTDHGGPDSYVCAETVSRTRIGDRDGVACMTVCNNATGGRRPIVAVLEKYSTIQDGFSQAPGF
ncbi:MAG TPA: hypothetical protein VKS60_09710 [Stellaceae bacterium]|nr:hypothetical protein [Stellaceae bacterium]